MIVLLNGSLNLPKQPQPQTTKSRLPLYLLNPSLRFPIFPIFFPFRTSPDLPLFFRH